MPTVVIGNNTGDDYAGTEDTRLVQTSSTTNYGSVDVFDMHKAVADEYLHSIIRFTGLSNITGPVTVSSAIMSLYHFNGSYTQTFSFRKILRNWVEAQSTWNIYSTGNNWSIAGATSDGSDRDSDVSATLTSSTSVGRFRTSSDLSADVQDFINGNLTNNGWHGERTDGADDGHIVRFRSANIGDGYRPYLSVTYEESGGTGGPLVGASALVGGGVLCGQGNLIN